MSRIAYPLLPALVLLGCRAETPGKPGAERAPVAVSVVPVETRMVDVVYRASGTLRARNTAVMSSKVMAYVQEVPVEAGAAVRQGDVLVRLEAREIEAGLLQAKAAGAEAAQGLEAASAAVEAARATEALARTTRKRFESLLAKRACSQQEYDEARARAEQAAAALQAAEAQRRLAESSGVRARAGVVAAAAMAGYTTVRAPFDGRVIARHVDPGNLVSPGVPLLVVEEAGAYQVEASVDESRAAAVAVGDPAGVILAAGGDRLEATVSEVTPAVEPGSRAFRVKIDLPAGLDPQKARPGSFARVELNVGAAERLLVPAAAVRAQGQLDVVFLVEGDRARLRLVTLGAPRGRDVEVLSGLNPGDRLVRTPSADLQDGDPVSANR